MSERGKTVRKRKRDTQRSWDDVGKKEMNINSDRAKRGEENFASVHKWRGVKLAKRQRRTV